MNLTKMNYAEFSEEVKEMLDNKLEEQMEEQGVIATLNKLDTLKGMFSDTLKEAMKKESDDEEDEKDEEDVGDDESDEDDMEDDEDSEEDDEEEKKE